jgi:hypothetical protein
MIKLVNGIGIIQIGAANNPIEFAFPARTPYLRHFLPETLPEDGPSVIAAIKGLRTAPFVPFPFVSSVIYFACRTPKTPGNGRRPVSTRSSDIRG